GQVRAIQIQLEGVPGSYECDMKPRTAGKRSQRILLGLAADRHQQLGSLWRISEVALANEVIAEAVLGENRTRERERILQHHARHDGVVAVEEFRKLQVRIGGPTPTEPRAEVDDRHGCPPSN